MRTVNFVSVEEQKQTKKKQSNKAAFFFLMIIALVVSSSFYTAYKDINDILSKQSLIEEVQTKSKELNLHEKGEMLLQASSWNQKLYKRQTQIPTESIKSYNEQLNISGNTMGCFYIPKLNLANVIQKDTSGNTKAFTHNKNTSLPIGGQSSHSVLTVRSFDNSLSKLKAGDIIEINILDNSIFYEVTEIYNTSKDKAESLFSPKHARDILTVVSYEGESAVVIDADRCNMPEDYSEYEPSLKDVCLSKSTVFAGIASISAISLAVVFLIERKDKSIPADKSTMNSHSLNRSY